MGTKVHCKSYLPGYYSMRDLNEDSSSSSWPLCYGDNKPITNGPYYNAFLPNATINGNPEDALKQKMLDHETVFKDQVYELHRLYRIQRDMMEQVDKKEPSSSSSSHQGFQAQKCHMAGFPIPNSTNGVKSPMSCTKAYNNAQPGPDPLGSRPLKMRKKLFDLQLPADEYIDSDEEEKKLNPIGLADLNEPFQIEETKGMNGAYKSNAGYLGVNRLLMNSSLESKVHEMGRFNIYEAGYSKANLSSLSRGHHDKLPLASHQVNPINHPFGMYQTGYNSREDHWREGNHHGLQSSYKNQHHSNNGHLEPLLASQPRPDSYPFFSSSCFDTSRAQPVTSWAKSTSSLTQKVIPLESSLNLDRNLMTSAHSQEPFGGKWLVNASSRSNPGPGSILTTMNGFYRGSTSGSKEPQVHLPSPGFINVALDHLTNHGLRNFPRGPCRPSSKPVIDINLNESSSNEADVIIIDDDTDHEEHLSALPWLKLKPARDKESVRDLNQPFTPEITFSSLDCEPPRKNENCETQNVKKILGFPIFEIKNEPASLVFDKDRKKRMIDINLECEPDEDIATKEPSKGISNRDYFDLNSCVSDCEEDPSIPSYESKTGSSKTTLEIDLEAPARLDSEDENTPSKELQSPQPKHDITQDESLRDAAEAIFAMSSSYPKPESLLWFVDAIFSCAIESRQKMSSFPEMDDFEAMTLQIQETKEQDYMPTPFVPEFEKFEDVGGNTLPTRGRKGHSRRGRPRRDFQRDILPGLASLSRHEVTEDIQTFTGLMRATGHKWSSGLTRRNGSKGGRGRKRAVVEKPLIVEKVNKIEDRSLIGWGKTTRRPRRQRCPSGNLPTTVVLT